MAALNFVAAEDGLEEDPKLLGLARILKVPRGMAFWYVLRWQRLILRRGNHMLGSLPKNFRAEDVAGFLEFRGNPRRLIDAMKKQGLVLTTLDPSEAARWRDIGNKVTQQMVAEKLISAEMLGAVHKAMGAH